MEQTRTKRIGDARIGDVSGEDSDVPHEDSDVSLRRVYQYQYPVFKRLESNVYFPRASPSPISAPFIHSPSLLEREGHPDRRVIGRPHGECVEDESVRHRHLLFLVDDDARRCREIIEA